MTSGLRTGPRTSVSLRVIKNPAVGLYDVHAIDPGRSRDETLSGIAMECPRQRRGFLKRKQVDIKNRPAVLHCSPQRGVQIVDQLSQSLFVCGVDQGAAHHDRISRIADGSSLLA